MNPTIVIPGIKGISIENFYPLGVSQTWSTWNALAGVPLQQILVSVAGDVDDADDVTNRPGQLLGPAYAKFVDGLRGRLGTPVYVFPYDWRLSNEINGKRLVAFVEHIRSKPMHSLNGWKNGERLVNLVGHSMGGLVARSALREWVDVRRAPVPVDAMVFIATPHLGSLDAVKGMIVGDTPILDFQKELRKLARALHSVYEMLPRFQDAVLDIGGQPLSVFEFRNWQSNVVQPSDGIQDVTQVRLTAAETFLANLPSPCDPATPQYKPRGQVISLFGNKVGSTLGSVKVIPQRTDTDGQTILNWYDFETALSVNGDQVVPVVSAKLPGSLGIEIPFSDVSFWPSEWLARASFHAFICTLDEVQTLVAGYLKDPIRTYNQIAPLNLRKWV